MNRSEAGKLGSLKLIENLLNTYNNNPKLCTNCKNPLYYKKRHNKFCSSSCSATYNNIGVARTGPVKNKVCIQCGDRLHEGSKFCKSTCESDYNFENNLTKRDSGSVRRYLLRHKNHVCEMCGNTEWLNQPIPLQVDHIDGHSENNDLQNLRLVCHNCHALTPTFGAKNRGHGRAYRRERYKQGKSS